jgi:predicted AlkP superfamily pyrophosphatase or phosphodiesterase
MNRLLVIQAAALGWDIVQDKNATLGGLTFHPAESVFPAVTCTAQASLRTASPPADHGMIANGRYFAEMGKPMFWEQSAALVQGERIWSQARARGKKVGMMFWQQSLGEAVDLVLSPKPVHKHGGGMIQDCYSQPFDLNAKLVKRIGRAFNLIHYWGPFASRKSSEWIVAGLCEVMSEPAWAPDILFGYIPHLDYDLQRHGPGSPQAAAALDTLDALLEILARRAEAHGYDVLVVGDYAIGPVVHGAVFPNRALRETGLFEARRIGRRTYPDFFGSAAFAVVDHEVAHVVVRDPGRQAEVQKILQGLTGVAEVLDRSAQAVLGVDHMNGGDLLLVAEEGAWFAYPWWTDPAEEPDFSGHIDIHNKPGFDPCELFMGRFPTRVTRDTSKVRGSHGRSGPGREIAWGTTVSFADRPNRYIDLAASLCDHLNRL